MAGLWGLKVLLFWAGIIGLTYSQVTKNGTKPTSPPSTTTSPVTDTSVATSPPSTGADPVINQSVSSSPPLTVNPPTVTAPNSTAPNSTAPTSTIKVTPTNSSSAVSLPNNTSSQSNSSFQESNSTTKSAITAPPITSKETSPTSNTSSIQPASQANSSHTQTSPPVTPPSTTVTATTKASQPQNCSYTVTNKNKLGLQIEITPSRNYKISLTEEGRPQTGKEIQADHLNQTSVWIFGHLKPCTNYSLSVSFINDTGNEIFCHSAENNFRTDPMSEGDVKEETSCIPGYVCYGSDWDISSSISTPNNLSVVQCTNDKKTFCVRPANEDICSDLTVTFTSGECRASSFSFTESISVDFLNTSEIKQSKPTGLPAEITTTLPDLPKCKNLSVSNYTCSEKHNPNVTMKLSELEPFTDYNCTGLILQNNTSINKTTPSVHVRVDCDLTITYTKNDLTSTSTEFSWTTTSKNCQQELPNLHKLSYDCICDGQKPGKGMKPTRPDGGKCSFNNLKPFTDYTCRVQFKYKTYMSNSSDVKLKTNPGIPDPVNGLQLHVQEHNMIKVVWQKSNDFKGEQKKYKVRINKAGEKQQKTEILVSNHEFVFKDLSYSTTYEVEVTAYNGEHESIPKTGNISTFYNDKAVIGFLVFLIILTSVALLFVIYKIYILKRRKSHDLGENIHLISTTNDEENLLLVEPIAAEVLLETYKRKLADEGRLFLAEFQSIPRIFSRYTVKEAKKSCNSVKNRYVDILPYDYNRVQLTTGNGEPGCDYINASFIDGFKESKKYIAAQGPKEETINDFWRMIWEQQSSIIVMVTRCEEGNRVKCAQYWPSPDRETELYEEFIVKLNSEDHYPDYTIRRLSLTNKREKNSEREVTHIQFMSWPDHGVPGEPHLLLKLRRRVNAFKNFFSGPIVVHCSAGVGRTGTYIGIDAMMEGLEAEGRVDIYGYVVRLRRQRCLMVQVEAQYILIHQALLEHNQFGETEISLSELHSAMNTLKEKNLDNEPTLMEEEFERLPTFKNWRTFNTGVTEENKQKNRSSSVIPYDFNRVFLKLDEGRSQDSDPDEDEEEEDSSDEEDEDSTQYINASHITGYWGCRAFIVAQTPLADTMGDFWSMIHQKKVYTVVMLSDSSEGDTDCIYWDKEKKSFGEIEVEVTSTDNSPNFIRRTMQIRHAKRKDRREINHFQFLKWTNKEVPEKPQDLTDMIKDIKQNCGTSKSQRNNPIVVHCDDGSSRSGVFCALWNVLDNAESEKLVDVFQVVKTLRKERQRMVSSLEQYQFIYDAVEAVFPVQNGEVKPVQASAADSVQIVNETKAAEQKEEVKAEEPASTTSNDQQAAAESTPLVSDGDKEEKKEEAEKEAPPTETTPLDDTSNGPTVTVEV
ncbi:receptor-type tyrosine-protein phosphatase C isoform X2 [Oreochromis niloticus]|uniref:receptor-type tyrosine-protein phosphatase C isoform X2 n=1 Tax=Oreochromis niloticus TaxID=8128 RepID=UPI000904C479|nr:receptor-type tyrosine-protein phosphatase C isoform X2 [Oreochromis niloticus]